MTPASAPGGRLSRRERLIALALAGAVLAGFVAANAHLIAVSVASQPDCVAERGGAALGAATRSC